MCIRDSSHIPYVCDRKEENKILIVNIACLLQLKYMRVYTKNKRGRGGCPVRRSPRYAFDTDRQNIIYQTLFFIGENEKQNYK